MSIDFGSEIELLTLSEVAKLLKISARGVRRLQQRRKIPFVKVGGVVRFVKNDVRTYLLHNRVEPIDP
jgi:excisionase family DNA binding protein